MLYVILNSVDLESAKFVLVHNLYNGRKYGTTYQKWYGIKKGMFYADSALISK